MNTSFQNDSLQFGSGFERKRTLNSFCIKSHLVRKFSKFGVLASYTKNCIFLFECFFIVFYFNEKDKSKYLGKFIDLCEKEKGHVEECPEMYEKQDRICVHYSTRAKSTETFL